MAKAPKRPSKTKATASKKPSIRAKSTTGRSTKNTIADAGETYLVFGTVTNADGTPVAGLMVMAYDKDESREDRLGKATTDTTGAYRISYSKASFRKTPKEQGGADVIVQVYNDQNDLLFTSKKKNSAPAKYQLNVQVPLQQYVVRVAVKGASATPLPNMIVRVFERDLRHPQQIGQGITDAGGEYRLTYQRADFQLGDLPAPRAPWLIVEVSETVEGEALARQEVQRADRNQSVSFTMANVGALSELQLVGEVIRPLLQGQGPLIYSRFPPGRTDLELHEIVDSDLDFIVAETGLDRAAVQAVAVASRIVRDAVARLDDEHAAQRSVLQHIGLVFFYALVRSGGKRDLDGVLRVSAADWRKDWNDSRAANRVPTLTDVVVNTVIESLTLLQQLQQLDPISAGNSEFVQILTNSPLPLPVAVALEALAIVREKGLDDAAALLTLAERYPDAEAPIKTFVRSVRVHRLADGHAGFARALNARLEGVSDSIAPLAALAATEWISMAGAAGITPGQSLRAQAFAEQQHPLTALESKVLSGQFELPGIPGNEVAALIKNQPAMVEKLLQGKMPASDAEPPVHNALRNTGRFMRTGVGMEVAAGIIKGGISSPGTALRYGRDYVHSRHSGSVPEEAAKDVIDNFFRVGERLLEGGKGVTIQIDINRRLPPGLTPAGMEPTTVPIPDEVRENAPTLAAFFGDLDECICRPCESMLGQPAYLVDLLNLLAKSTSQNGTALDVLRARRPDIFKLELSCEKAEDTIQHIDIVLEILEKAAAPEASANATAEDIQQIAYPKLRRAMYPWHLPFDRGYAEVGAYLTKLGMSREKVLGLQRDTLPMQLAAEILQTPMDQTSDAAVDSQWSLLSQQRLGTRLWAAYGFDIVNDIAVIDPASRELLTNQTIEDVLTRASFLIDRTGLSLEELEQALQTEFVAGVEYGIELNGREQCKTSAMRLPAEASVLEGILDRLHRFTRLRAKLPGWSIEQLGQAIAACDGVETEESTPQSRADLLVKLTIIKRLQEEHGLSLDALVERPMSEAYLRKALGLSLLQFSLLIEITGYSPTTQSVDWHGLEGLCQTARRLREVGLSVEQAAQALMTRDRWKEVAGELPLSIKSDEQIGTFLGEVQKRLRSVVVIRTDVGLETQAAEALQDIFDQDTSASIIAVIREASSPEGMAPDAALLAKLVKILSRPGDRRLGEWMPIMGTQEAEALLSVTAPNNPDADERFTQLLTALASRRRERELVSVISAQCALGEAEVAFCLGERLLLDPPAQGNIRMAFEAFLDPSFWADISSTQPGPPSTAAKLMPRLHAWVDRLYRLIALTTALAIDPELMQIADQVAVESEPGINWRDMLASAPVNHTTWQNPQWQALLDLLWLQLPDQLSRPALSELLRRLTAPNAQVSDGTLRPLTSRVNIDETLAQPLVAQAFSAQPTTLDLRNPGRLRLAFEWLQLARHLRASAVQLSQLADLADNAQAAMTAKALLHARLHEQALSEEELKEIIRKIEDPMRRQRRDALVAYHIAQVVGRNNADKWSDTKALYEHFLIDHQMEPCLETTWILEAVTAVQLFTQRILFGIEPEITAASELHQRWTWMRNYRVWEANRKVFLFPENWLFPELRDDKSSSFKQLESALGQGELTQDLANQAFGQFLDDVAQMGQVQVLGMYEDIALLDTGAIDLDSSGLPRFRTLYVIGRSINPPYAYFWRHCVDFGSSYMEWSPWQRIELDIHGDHVLPFVFGGRFHVAWPRFQQKEPKDKPDLLELRMYWSRLNGANWDRVENSKEPMEILIPAFQDERTGYSFRCQRLADAVTLICYRRASSANLVSSQTKGTISESTRQLDPDLRFEFNARSMRERGNSFAHLVVPANGGNPLMVFGSLEGLPSGADAIGAVLIVDWEVWVQARDINSTVGFVRLDSDARSRIKFTIDATVAGIPCFSKGVSESIGLWVAHGYDSAPQSLPDTQFTVRVDGIVSPGSVQLVTGVTDGVLKEMRLRFVCNFNSNNIPTLADLGVESANRFEPACQFVMHANGRNTWQSPYRHQHAIPLLDRFRVSMNGQEAAATALPVMLHGENRHQGALTPFQSPFRSTGTVWLAGSSSHLSPTAMSGTWFYRDENEGCLLDAGWYNSRSGQSFDAIAFNYDDAQKYWQAWHESPDQFMFDPAWGKFGSDALPDLTANGNIDYWERQRAGKMAFDPRMPYACYNWEVFFHAPLLIADQLSKQHKFEDAERWLRFVFDPTGSETGTDAKRFLKFRVFKELDLNQQVIDDLTLLAQVAGGYGDPDSVKGVQKLIDRWRDAPFRPFLIARRRHIAFLWRTLFAYLDNLIAWADSLYRRDTRESINEATMLYVLAERILGRRPKLHKGSSNRGASCYEAMTAKWDEFANFWINAGTQGSGKPQTETQATQSVTQPNPDGMLYFCMPFNDKLLSYWNTVDARLSNIRSCRNIEGIQRKLPLMDAPIDPELLVRATAAGLNLGDVIAGLYAPPPHYRYSILSSRAAELANECKSLGAAMLSAIEKRDAEYLAQLRSSNEISLLKLVRAVRTLQISEAEGTIEALRASRKTVSARYAQYQRLLGKKDIKTLKENESAGEDAMLGTIDSGLASNRSNWGLIKEENEQYVGVEGANTWSMAANIAKFVGSGLHVTASALAAVPADLFSKSAKVMGYAGTASSTIGDAFSMASQGWRVYAEQQGMMAGHIRRRDEWAFQSNQALKELQQIDKQILANQIRIDITKKELDNHLEQIEQAKAVDEVMRSKFSNVQLYEWMKAELSRLYFNAYRMAVDMARRAERAASRELGVKPLNIVRNDYWDSLRDGLLAGERLHQDLKRLEIAYFDQNRREYELTKHISLRRLNPEALVQLRATTARCTCQFDIPEWLFDLDAPGHYLRRIKSVSVSIPSVTGPFTSVNCKLTLLKSAVRHENSLEVSNRYLRLDSGDDDRFIDYFGATEAIVTSTGSADSGMFEMQLRDERFLPFEGNGVISTWRIELPAEYPQFDYSTISDVILTVRYTARDGGDLLRDAATGSIASLMTLPQQPNNEPLRFSVLLSCRSDFSTQWARANATTDLSIPITRDVLPYWMEAVRIGAGSNVKKLAVREVSVADVLKERAPTPSFSKVWPPESQVSNGPRQWSANALTDGVGTGNTGPLPNTLADRLLLLSVSVPP